MQPAIRFDYQLSGALRVTGKFAGQLQTSKDLPGTVPGFNDSRNFTPNRYTWSTTVNWTANSTTFVEGDVRPREERAGHAGHQPGGGPEPQRDDEPADAVQSAGRVVQLRAPGGLLRGPDSHRQAGVPWFSGSAVSLVPTFSWGSRISGVPNPTAVADAMGGVPQINMNRSQDATASITKVYGRHTFKAGGYWNHAYKAQGLGAAGGVVYVGTLNFGNDTNNPLDTGFGFANAALGVFSTYQQQSQYVEGAYVYNNLEWYVQDNWRVSSRLTLDYGVRFVWMQPTYDTRKQSSNFFLDQWNAAETPRLYVAMCPNNVNPCSTSARQAMDPLTGVSLGPGSSFAIGQIVPNSGNLTNGIVQAGEGISKYNYTWPTVVVAPRFGFAYDLSGDNRLIVRGGVRPVPRSAGWRLDVLVGRQSAGTRRRRPCGTRSWRSSRRGRACRVPPSWARSGRTRRTFPPRGNGMRASRWRCRSPSRSTSRTSGNTGGTASPTTAV